MFNKQLEKPVRKLCISSITRDCGKNIQAVKGHVNTCFTVLVF